jgi:hypothetical protein
MKLFRRIVTMIALSIQNSKRKEVVKAGTPNSVCSEPRCIV